MSDNPYRLDERYGRQKAPREPVERSLTMITRQPYKPPRDENCSLCGTYAAVAAIHITRQWTYGNGRRKRQPCWRYVCGDCRDTLNRVEL